MSESDKNFDDNSQPKESVQKSAEDDPDTIFRIYSVLSYIFVLVVIGLPIWWMTTRVYRASLPLDDMFNVDVPYKMNQPHGIPLSLEYDVLLTIVNPDPQYLKLSLDAKDLDRNLQPFLSTISDVANFTVKSQWLYLVDLGVSLQKMHDHYALNEDQLPHVITPLEKKLWSHMSPRPSLNLIIYVSPCKDPIYLYKKNGDKVETNAFLSPRWGGVLFINVDKISCDNGIFEPELRVIIATFVAQLRQLLGIRGGTAQDMLDFQISKVREMIDSTRRTLKSLAQLLSEISSIVISDDVAHKIRSSVEYANKAEELLQGNDVGEALQAAKIAFEKSEAAFGDPSLLALLYFPDDQKYAVYIPLFLPVMIPVLMSLTTVRRWYISHYKKTK